MPPRSAETHGTEILSSKILGTVTAPEAIAHPVANAHSIWELVLHVEAWVQFSLAAVRGVPIPAWRAMSKEQDWPAVAKTGEDEWTKAVDSFFAAHSKLVDALRTLNDDRLDEIVPGRTYNFYQLFHGMIQHAVYHGGQIALLRKAFSKHNQ